MVVGLEEEVRQDEAAQGYGAAIASKKHLEERTVERLQAIFNEFDMNGSEDISFQEFKHCLQSPDTLAFFGHLEIDVSDAKSLFELLDRRRTNVLERDDFVLGCLRLRGTAKSSTLAKVQVKVEELQSDLSEVRQVTAHVARMLNRVHSDQLQFFTSETEDASLAGSPTSKHTIRFCEQRTVAAGGANAGAGARIDKAEERAMTLHELREVRRVIVDQCMADKWVDVVSGAELLPKDVTLYTFNYYHISPKTVLQHCTLEGLDCGPVRQGQRVVQENPEWCRHYSLHMAEGRVLEDSNNGRFVKVKLMRGRFADHKISPGARITIDGKDCGEPDKVVAEESVSYKEFVSSESTPPKWYTCHWWGTPVLDFVCCCEQHSKLRKLSPDMASYWTCAYANRQHDLNREINVPNLMDTSFYKAMQIADGVLLILDSAATPFTRIWCSFELYKTVTTDKLLDIATAKRSPHSDKEVAKLIVEGLLPGEPRRAKMVREQDFPYPLVMAGMSKALENGGAYFKPDIDRVLHFMAMDGPNGEDLKTKQTTACRKANRSLNAYFALAAWPFAMQKKMIQGDLLKPPEQRYNFIDILHRDSERRVLNFSLAHFLQVGNTDLEDVVNALPPNLVELRLGFEGCVQITNAGLMAFRGKLPATLQKLQISFMACTNISDLGVLVLAEELPQLLDLRELKIDCGMCADITRVSIKAIAENLPQKLQTCEVLLRGTMVGRDFRTATELRQAAQGRRLRMAAASIAAGTYFRNPRGSFFG